jgi:hypothetical protein
MMSAAAPPPTFQFGYEFSSLVLILCLHCYLLLTQKGSGNFDIAALDREPDPGTQVSIAVCYVAC